MMEARRYRGVGMKVYHLPSSAQRQTTMINQKRKIKFEAATIVQRSSERDMGAETKKSREMRKMVMMMRWGIDWRV